MNKRFAVLIDGNKIKGVYDSAEDARKRVDEILIEKVQELRNEFKKTISIEIWDDNKNSTSLEV